MQFSMGVEYNGRSRDDVLGRTSSSSAAGPMNKARLLQHRYPDDVQMYASQRPQSTYRRLAGQDGVSKTTKRESIQFFPALRSCLILPQCFRVYL